MAAINMADKDLPEFGYFATLREDFARTTKRDEKITLAVVRAGQFLDRKPGLTAFVLRRLYRAADTLWVQGVIGAAFPQQARIGPGLRLPHAGRGVILHHTVRVGARATIYHQVTIGVKNKSGAARIGSGTEIGAGAKIIGPINVGSHCLIGANAVVTRDVPDGHTAVGVPARNISHGLEPKR